jgi:catechol 2,3-dioxygenase-like lactoylglutathione lyase family enzyme
MQRSIIVGIFFTLVGTIVAPGARAQSAANTAVRASRVILRVSDLDRSTAFYRDRVGLKLQSINEEFAVFEAGGMILMLEHLPKPPSSPSAGLAAFTEIVLESTDVLATHAAMQARGVQFKQEPRAVTSDDARVMYAADFRDPDGHVLSIAGWVPRRNAAK